MPEYRETLHTGFEQVLHIKGEPIADERSAYQHITIFDSEANGRVLVLDDILQLTNKDEAGYSEMLAHPPILEHGQVRSVLIVGGGDGAVAEEVLKHAGVRRVDLVDIDARVVELCRTHFPDVHKGAFDDPRLTFHPADAFQFLADTPAGTYDLVIADRPDPVGPAASLFAQDFYARLERAMADKGIAVFQTGAPFFQSEELRETHGLLCAAFPRSGAYLTVVPTYTGGFMALTWASKGFALGEAPEPILHRRAEAAGLVTDYYSPGVHRAAFALPPWLSRILRG
jgi:spermidine synthase